ncbi:MAG: amidohydrolase family protein [Gemmatimonadales bacterium]
MSEQIVTFHTLHDHRGHGMRNVLLVMTLVRGSTAPLLAQEMTIDEYQPRSSLIVPEHPRTRSRFRFIDAHAHPRGTMSSDSLDALVAAMDAMNMGVMVNLSGGQGERLQRTIANMRGRYPDRFVVFANLIFRNIGDPDWTNKAVNQLEMDVRAGASGLKIFKNLGMTVKDENGERLHTDDPRLDPVWAKAGELGIPVLIHTGDPFQFWQPQDKYNERWFELKERPRRIRPPDRFPPWKTIMQEQWNVIRRHPETTFISAHLSWLGGNLARLGKLLDEMPNMNTEIGAVLAELGRQPKTAREWLIKYQDRVLFGKDAWGPSEYHVYFRELETDDEYFEYYRKRHAFWRLYGLQLPDSVLRKIYYENALRIIPGIDKSLFPSTTVSLDYPILARHIVDALDLGKENVILRYDPQTMERLPGTVARAMEARGARVDLMPYGRVPQFNERLARAQVYVWLSASPRAETTPEQSRALVKWLDTGAGREIHFHWGAGSMGTDGIVGVHSPTYDSIYAAALDIDYAKLDRTQSAAVDLLRSGEVHVTTPAGTDISFRIGSRSVNKQNGDASKKAMAGAQVRIDREIELPAGVIRVAPLEETVSGIVVVPWARFGSTRATNVRLTVQQGRVTDISAASGQYAVRAALDAQSALRSFREFALGFNPRLVQPENEPWLPYYGYGAGVVRLSLGNNAELGGNVRGEGVRWFFFPDATVTVGGSVLVDRGRLVNQ